MHRPSAASLILALGCLPASARFCVEGESMRPTLRNGQQVLAHRIRPADGPPRRGDVVVLRHPLEQGNVIIKRVIGLPGEYLRLAQDAVYVNGQSLAEPYLDGPPCPVNRYPREWVVAPDAWFVLGDRRTDSQDSRAFGPVHRELILAQVWWRCWPPHAWGRVRRAGTLRGSAPG